LSFNCRWNKLGGIPILNVKIKFELKNNQSVGIL
jgi:hypothetical protein